jgi:hypothetical protein
MLASGSLLEPRLWLESAPNRTWMAGALAGMIRRDGCREESWEWSCFIDDLRSRLELTGITEPVWPGSNGIEGSHYDTLGGYASTCATDVDGGLRIPLPTVLKETVLRLLSGIAFCCPDGCLMIPSDKLDNFSRLVNIRGPLSKSMEVFM